MILPEYAAQCIDQLEAAGFATYAVGGCVRDWLLGLTPHDYDLCTAATPEEIKQVFSEFPLVLAGEKHGTVGVVLDREVVEITTFRTEGTYHDHRHPDKVDFVTDITLDLSRRDFTVNAMAFSPSRGLADPFGGANDLKSGILRTVGDPTVRFTEDALRILRGVRFAVRYGLTPEANTEQAMNTLAPLMDSLARERVFDELCKLLPLVQTHDLLRYGNILAQIIPELKPMMGFAQHSRFHAYDIYTHTAHAVAAAPRELTLRWAALLHDVGKPGCFTLDENGEGHFYGHAQLSAQMADTILHQLKAPTALRERVTLLIDKHMTPLTPDKKLLRRRLSQYGEEAVRQLLSLQRADYAATGKAGDAPDYTAVTAILEALLREEARLTVKSLAVNGHDLMALGYRGPEIGKALSWLLDQVLEERIPNQRQPLLDALENHRR